MKMPTAWILQAELSQFLGHRLKNIVTTGSVRLGLERAEFGTVFQRLQVIQDNLEKTYHGSLC
eukprot:5503781-Ditylum_brightwellii.AAC.1